MCCNTTGITQSSPQGIQSYGLFHRCHTVVVIPLGTDSPTTLSQALDLHSFSLSLSVILGTQLEPSDHVIVPPDLLMLHRALYHPSFPQGLHSSHYCSHHFLSNSFTYYYSLPVGISFSFPIIALMTITCSPFTSFSASFSFSDLESKGIRALILASYKV